MPIPVVVGAPGVHFGPSEEMLSAKARLCQVTELMKLYNLCCKYGLYEEAEKIALKTCELDPQNVAALAAVRVAHLLANMKHSGTIGPSAGGKCLENCPAFHGSPVACPNGDCEKQKQISELKEQFRTFFKEGKYAEAMKCAAKALELDPACAQAAAAYQMARMQSWLQAHKGTPRAVAVNKQIQALLSQPISLNFHNAELAQIIDDLRDISGIKVVADVAALERAGIDLHKKISLSIENVPMATALKLLLQQAHLIYIVKDGVLQVTTAGGTEKKCTQAKGCPRAACVKRSGYKIPTEQMQSMGRLSCGLYCSSIAAVPCGGLVGPGVAACVPCFQLVNALECFVNAAECSSGNRPVR
jgi:tetratricopeptide (TPR) repeat protein